MAVSEQTERVAEMLRDAGWRSPHDAQWENLESILPALRAELAARGPVLSRDEVIALKSAIHEARQAQNDQTKFAGLAHYASVAEVLRNLLERAKA
jgi:hypothetical protein